MSAGAAAIALHHSRATGTAKLILLGIADHDGDGGAWPKVLTLAKYANCNERNARLAVRRLEELGEITTSMNGGGGGSFSAEHMRPSLYTITLKCPPNCDGSRSHKLLCVVCGKELPHDRRFSTTHRACDQGSLATPPVASDPYPRSPATPEVNPEHTTELNNAPRLLKREEVATLSESERCPARSFAPHSFSKGRCLDCRAVDPEFTTDSGDQS